MAFGNGAWISFSGGAAFRRLSLLGLGDDSPIRSLVTSHHYQSAAERSDIGDGRFAVQLDHRVMLGLSGIQTLSEVQPAFSGRKGPSKSRNELRRS